MNIILSDALTSPRGTQHAIEFDLTSVVDGQAHAWMGDVDETGSRMRAWYVVHNRAGWIVVNGSRRRVSLEVEVLRVESRDGDDWAADAIPRAARALLEHMLLVALLEQADIDATDDDEVDLEEPHWVPQVQRGVA